MNKSLHIAGLVVAASIPIFILPARLSEGQWKDPQNLIGSEIVIFLMSLACWYSINLIQQKFGRWQSLVLSLLCCCLLSNVFYFTFNPFFKDFPFRTAQNPLAIKILMLCSRGILMSVILIPAAYYLKRDREARRHRQENERLAIEKVKIEKKILEKAVAERTVALQLALSSLEKSQATLEDQFHIQSRLIASITHDIRGPLNFLVIVSQEVNRLIENKEYGTLGQYSQELHKSLEKMLEFVKNILEFAKLPVQQQLAISEDVNLDELIREKAAFFEGIIQANSNELSIDLDPGIIVKSNVNLLGIVLHNLIDNANKYTQQGSILIRTSKDQDVPQLLVENSGNTVPEQVSQWVNARNDSRHAEQSLPTDTHGIGLILVKEIAYMLNIRLSMESREDMTSVCLTFPKDDGLTAT